MVRTLSIAFGLASLLAVGTAVTGTPFGSDDTGNLPTQKTTITCENAVGKDVSKLVACIGKCHAARAAGKITDDAGEETCEEGPLAGKSCKERFVATMGKLGPKCPGQCAVNNGTADGVILLVDSHNNLVYCAASPSGAFLE